MNVLFISPNSPYESIGGVERYITNLINFYRNKSNGDVYLMIPTIGKSKVEKDGNVTIYFENTFSIPRHAARHQKEIVANALLFAEVVEKIIKEKNIDVICAENIIFGPPAVYSLHLNMKAALNKVPLVLRLHMYPASALQIELVNQLMWSKISCVSKSVAGDCFQKGADINVLSTDYLGVDVKEFSAKRNVQFSLREKLELPDDTKIILTAARLIRGNTNIIKEKGLDNLIEAFSKLSPRYPNLRLLFSIGKATENLKDDFDQAWKMLQGYLKIHHVENKSILKMFSLTEMPDVYQQSDLFVLPSEMNETFGQTFVEAMSCGTPVVGAKTGGVPEIISDSYNGYLVPPDDSSVLAQRIEKLLMDKSTKERFVKAGIKTVEDTFTAEKQFTNFHEMLKSTCASKSN